MATERQFTISELCRPRKWNPKDVSALFYNRAIPDEAAPIMSGRRLIPESLVWLIEAKLRAAGKLPHERQEAANG